MDQNNNGQQQNSQRQPSAATHNQNTGMSFLLKKGEKLTTALYMVTDIMSEKEPMKWKIRENGVELLSDIAVSYGASASERMSVMSNAIKKIDKIVSFLEITERARMISEMNASVLKKEYLALKDAVEKEWNNIYDKSKSIFSDSFFEVSREPVRELKDAPPHTPLPTQVVSAPRETHASPAQVHQTSIVRTEPMAQPPTQSRTQPSQQADTQVLPQGQSDTKVQHSEREQGQQPKSGVVESDQVSQRDVSANGQTPFTRPQPSQGGSRDSREAISSLRPIVNHQPQTIRPTLRDVPAVRIHGEGGSSERRAIILNKIKEKPSINVRDLADSIPHVSEKTIQRELLAMVAEGLLVKRGERRWSTYSLRIS